MIELTESDSDVDIIEYTDEDKIIAQWMSNSLTDSEEFDDISDYRYYARALNLDMDFFLSADMWEVFYNTDTVNRNREVENKCTYLIRLNPNKLLEIYAERNNCTIDELCVELSVSQAQLYYNWGYSPMWVSYLSNHKNNIFTYSDKENSIFGINNNENRSVVMKTHMLVIDFEEDTVEYSSNVSDNLALIRRDMMQAFTDSETYIYSEYSDAEKAATFTINGIGIRTVIPLSVPNAWMKAEGADVEITPMLNFSPYTYGCTDADMVDIAAILNDIYGEE